MGNTEGNTAVESGERSVSRQPPLHMLKRNLLFPEENLHSFAFSKINPSAALMVPDHANRRQLNVPTKLRGELIAFKTSGDNPLSSHAVDLRVEKSDRGNERSASDDDDSYKANKDSSKTTSSGNFRLKFGIDSILKSDSDSSKNVDNAAESISPKSPKRNELQSPVTQKSSIFDVESTKRLTGFFSHRYQHPHDYRQKIYGSEGKKFPQHFHPYAKPRWEKPRGSFDESTFFQTTKNRVENARGRSLSPYSKVSSKLTAACNTVNAPGSPNADRRATRLEVPREAFFGHRSQDPIEDAIKKNTLSPGFNPPLGRDSCGDSTRRSTSVNSSPISPGIESLSPGEKEQKFSISSRSSYADPRVDIRAGDFSKRFSVESDDVFNDERDVRHKRSPVAPLFSPWNPRPFSQSENSFPPTPELLSLSNQRRGALNFFSSLSNHPGFPSTSPPLNGNLNLQAWQAMAANCHLRSLVYNPYVYISAIRDKCNPPPGIILPSPAAVVNSPGKNIYDATRPSNDQPNVGDKSGRQKPRRKWTRAVFSLMQRRGLEKSFQHQKYVAKPERRRLADALRLTDNQVKVWYQNRRMKFRQEQKSSAKMGGGVAEEISPPNGGGEIKQAAA